MTVVSSDIKMLEFPLQIGLESFLFIIPIVICLLMSLRQGKGGRAAGGPVETDLWHTQKNISEAFQLVNEHTQEWMKEEVEVKPSRPVLFGRSEPSVAYKVIEETDPRLLKLGSRREGVVTFELTEVQGGGTVVKTIFSPGARSRVQSLRAHMPLTVPGMKACDVCERLILSEFTHCPYCGIKQDQDAV